MQINIAKVSTYLSVIGSILAGLIFAVTWLDNHIATKDDLSIMYTELRLHQIEESLLSYQKQGIDNLSDMDRHRYEQLIKAESAISSQRNSLLGLPH